MPAQCRVARQDARYRLRGGAAGGLQAGDCAGAAVQGGHWRLRLHAGATEGAGSASRTRYADDGGRRLPPCRRRGVGRGEPALRCRGPGSDEAICGGGIASKPMAEPATMFDKIWSQHVIETRADGATLLHIDRHLVHDGSANAFRMLKQRNLALRRLDRTFATPDHYVSTLGRDLSAINEPSRRAMVEDLEANARANGVTLFGLKDRRQGIVHVVGPEQGLSQPGMIMVC